MIDPEIRLTPEQEAVAHAAKSERIVVEAGAGTGKTYTLVERLRWLIEEQGCRPPGILVLSFSRAVVESIRMRTKDAGLAAVDVRTFDSFALELALPAPDNGQALPDFNRQVQAASAAILTDPTAQDLIHDFEHVLIDEAQDLVAPRSAMVRSLLSQLRCGFTMFGDRAQAIYDFAIDRAAPAQDDDLLSWVRKLPDVRKLDLSRAFRAKGKWPLEAIRLQDAVRSRPESAYDDLVSLTYRLPVVPPSAALAPFIEKAAGRVAFLCRTNGDALVLSSQLDSVGITHTVRRGAHERPMPKWLGQAVAGVATPMIDTDELCSRIVDVLPSGTLESERILDLLQRIGRSGPRRSDLRKVAERVQRGALPPLLMQEYERTVASTIHRAKGLEFEHVVLCTNDWVENELVASAEAARVLFVALTRAKSEIFQWQVKLPKTTRAKGRLTNRWTITSFRGRARRVSALEFRATDIDVMWPTTMRAEDFVAHQRHLSYDVGPGDQVVLTRLELRSGIPVFAIEHQGTSIGRTSDDWGAAIMATVDSNVRRVPARIHGLRIDRVLTTAVATSSSGNAASAGGLYLQVWLRGLANIDVDGQQ